MTFWLLQAAQLTVFTLVTWHRTGLVISTMGGAAAALASVLFLVLHAVG